MARPKTKGDPIVIRLALSDHEFAAATAAARGETVNQLATRVLTKAIQTSREASDRTASDRAAPPNSKGTGR